jgi:hypothetical protein
MQVSEPRLIELLEKVSEQSEKKSKVRVRVEAAASQASLAVIRCSPHALCRLRCALQVTIQRRRGVLDDDW